MENEDGNAEELEFGVDWALANGWQYAYSEHDEPYVLEAWSRAEVEIMRLAKSDPLLPHSLPRRMLVVESGSATPEAAPSSYSSPFDHDGKRMALFCARAGTGESQGRDMKPTFAFLVSRDEEVVCSSSSTWLVIAEHAAAQYYNRDKLAILFIPLILWPSIGIDKYLEPGFTFRDTVTYRIIKDVLDRMKL